MRTMCSVAAIIAVLLLAMPAPASAQIGVGVSITLAPPALPVYVQPVCPAVGYMWTPGYWAWGPDGYFWVPGTWIMPPAVGLLWTPGYWGWAGGIYAWHGGYWGPHIGFYGGVNYGFGYTGAGFAGGYWRGGAFYYNRAVSNINVTVVHNTYNTTVVNNNVSHVSFNGGEGGITARPTAQEEAWGREQHTPATSVQMEQEHTASTNHDLLASVNYGRPTVAATAKPGDFSHGVVAARAAGNENAAAKAAATHADRPASANANRAPATHENAPAARNDRPPSASSNRAPATRENAPAARTDRPPATSTSHPATSSRTDRPPASTNASHPSTTHNPPAQHTQPSHETTPHQAPAQHTAPPKTQHESAPKQQSHESKPPATHEAERPH